VSIKCRVAPTAVETQKSTLDITVIISCFRYLIYRGDKYFHAKEPTNVLVARYDRNTNWEDEFIKVAFRVL
jgi:hypothetical protein